MSSSVWGSCKFQWPSSPAKNINSYSTCFISAFRVIFLQRPVDFTYDAIKVLCWSHSELSSGIICATIPTLKPLLGKYIPALGTTRKSTKGYQKYDHSSRGKDFASPRSTDFSTKDTGIYGLADLEGGLERPQPVKLDMAVTTTRKHSPKASLPISVRSISTPSSDENMRDELQFAASHPSPRLKLPRTGLQKE